jgi:predicted membrane protein (TIGR00267 family)
VEESGNPRERFVQRIDDVREYGRIAGVAEIARRYFAMNAFDGVLTTIGVLMGNYLGDVRSPGTVIRIGIATSIAMGVSGLWGAYLTEAAERERDLAELERVSLTDLGHTKIGRASRMAVVIVALVDGLAPALAALIVLIPLFAASLIGSILVSYALSLALALIGLFGLGMFLGRISGRGLIGYGLRTLVAGLVSIALSFVLGDAGP